MSRRRESRRPNVVVASLEIDLNVRTTGNLTYVGFDDVAGCTVDDLDPGDEVVVTEPESGVKGMGWVHCIDYERGLIYLTIGWDTIT